MYRLQFVEGEVSGVVMESERTWMMRGKEVWKRSGEVGGTSS